MKIIYFIMAILMCSVAYAEIGVNITSPDEGSIYYITNQIPNYYINISVNASATCTINSSLWDLISYDTTIQYCYQESVNVSTGCGGLATGSWNWSAPSGYQTGGVSDIFDENYGGNYAKPAAGNSGTYYINYSKPTAATAAIWQSKTSVSIRNDTVLASCYDYFSGYISLRMYHHYESGYGGDDFELYCFNGTWAEIFVNNSDGDCNEIYEESIWWEYGNNQTALGVFNNNTNLPDDVYNLKVECNRTGLTNGSDTLQFEINTTIGLDNCSQYTTPTINYTFLIEGNDTPISSDYDATFNYRYGSNYGTYSTDQTDRFNLSICIYPPNIQLSGNYSIYYSATDYPQRRYTENTPAYSNITQEINLYLLSENDGIYIRFSVTDQYSEAISSVQVDMQIDDETVEQENTDDSGLATFFADPDQDYVFIFTKEGYETLTYTLRPTTSEIYQVTMNSESTDETPSYFVGIAYTFEPTSTNLNNDTVYNFVFNMTSTYWNITNCTLFINNDTETLSYSSTAYDTDSCEIVISQMTGNQTTITAEAQYTVNNTVITVAQIYSVKYSYVGDFSIKNFIDDFKSFSAAGFNDFTRMIIGIIIIAVILVSLAKGASVAEPLIYVVITIVLVWTLSYVGIFTMNNNYIPTEWLKQYIIAILVTLLGGSFIISEQTR